MHLFWFFIDFTNNKSQGIKIIRNRNFTILPCMLQFLENLWHLFIFSNPIWKTAHFMLELLNTYFGNPEPTKKAL